MKLASVASIKWGARSAAAGNDYLQGAKTTDKDQASRAIAAKEIYKQALTASFARDSYAKGLAKSGKQGWLTGIEQKGATNYATGVSTQSAIAKYASESGRYDSARRAADGLARGPRGSATNLARVAAVANALRAVKVGR